MQVPWGVNDDLRVHGFRFKHLFTEKDLRSQASSPAHSPSIAPEAAEDMEGLEQADDKAAAEKAAAQKAEA